MVGCEFWNISGICPSKSKGTCNPTSKHLIWQDNLGVVWRFPNNGAHRVLIHLMFGFSINHPAIGVPMESTRHYHP